MPINRRQLLQSAAFAGLSLAVSPFPFARALAADGQRKKVLFFTKSSGFEHSSIKRKGDQLSHAEMILTDLGSQRGYDVTCTKDGRFFDPDKLSQWDCFAFYTTGDLTTPGTDKQPPMSHAGKAAFLQAITDGKGYIGFHSATDTCHSPTHKKGELIRPEGEKTPLDPYIAMLGGEFIIHGKQQASTMRVTSTTFPGLAGLQDFNIPMEEWYSLKNFQKNLHVVLAQETKGMTGDMYARPSYPATWARAHGKGRVFYTNMGHREDVWTNDTFQKVILAGLAWSAGNVAFDPVPNIDQVTPKAELPTSKA